MLPLEDILEDAVERELVTAPPGKLKDDGETEELVARAIRSICKDEIGKKPVVRVLINRLEA